MARARMIARNITKSKKVAQVSTLARVVYAFTLPFLDREGRYIAEPGYIKQTVFRHLEYTEEEIGSALQELHAALLITIYPTEDDVVMQYTDFLVHNKPDRKEVASEFPPPSSELLERLGETPSHTTQTAPLGNAGAMPRQSFG